MRTNTRTGTSPHTYQGEADSENHPQARTMSLKRPRDGASCTAGRRLTDGLGGESLAGRLDLREALVARTLRGAGGLASFLDPGRQRVLLNLFFC